MPSEFDQASFDQDMSVTESGDASAVATPPPGSPTPVETTAAIKAGGREYASASDLAKAHDALLRDYTKKGNELGRMKDLANIDKFLRANPELEGQMRKLVKEYEQRRAGGQPQQAAAQATGLPPEFAKRLEMMDSVKAELDDIKLERETNDLKSRYNLNDGQVLKVYEISEANGGIPLEAAYKIASFDAAIAQARAQGKQEQAKHLQDKKDAFVGGSAADGRATTGGKSYNPASASRDDWRNAVKDDLRGMGAIKE